MSKTAAEKLAGILHSGDWHEESWDDADAKTRRYWITIARRLIANRDEVMELLDEAMR